MLDGVDFSSCPRVTKPYGGTDRKFGVLYNGDTYMLKFAQSHAKKGDSSTSHINNVVSEYISSHIAQSVGIDAHSTLLGTYKDEIVVACKDFRKVGDENIEFEELMLAKFDKDEIKRFAKLSQIYDIYNDSSLIPVPLRKAAIDAYWDIFVIDALVGNFDRHIGNWGFLVNQNVLRIAPAYDFGSTLLPTLSDEGVCDPSKTEGKNLLERCFVFPSPKMYITKEKTGKVGYYDMLASGYDINCSEALLRIAPRIDLKKIDSIIDNTPYITDVRKEFYKRYIKARKSYIIDLPHRFISDGKRDLEALKRVTTGDRFDITLLNEKYEFLSQIDPTVLSIRNATATSVDYIESVEYKGYIADVYNDRIVIKNPSGSEKLITDMDVVDFIYSEDDLQDYLEEYVNNLNRDYDDLDR
ncbi:MAG: HipA domain-containing protein [Clostridiales bacterium]|nr:HipA domain-containing protein [Clostridiales bacterium]